MNRRDFLCGLAATAAAIGAMPALPTQAPIGAQVWFDQWMEDCLPIWQDYYENILIFGCGALKQIDKYPYIESIHSREFTIMPSGLGLLQKA